MQRNILITLTAVLGIVLSAGMANAVAIGIDVGDGVWTTIGEDNTNGLQITATSFGSIALDNNASSSANQEEVVTVDGITFTFNVDAAERAASFGDYNCILEGNQYKYSDPVPWRLEGMQAGSLWNLAFLSAYSYEPGKFTVDGVGTATPDADGDGNFEGVTANSLGHIEGTWDSWESGVWSTFDAVLIEQVAAPVPEPATMLLFGLGLLGLAGVNRRKK